jgi:xanthosine utilization system XapX-like protein
MDVMTFSALASVSDPISPTMDTMAVCGMLGLLVGKL